MVAKKKSRKGSRKQNKRSTINRRISTLDLIKKEVEKEKKDVAEIEKNIELLKDKLLEKRPSHFSRRDIANATFGSLLVGIAFVLKGAVIRTATYLTSMNIVLIIVSTIVILLSQIYFISYTRVKKKHERNVISFFAKRFFSLYIIAIIVSFFLIYVMGVNYQFDTFSDTMKAVVLLSMPSAVGAAVPNLLKKY